MSDPNEENNTRAVVLSEELDFLNEFVAKHGTMMSAATARELLERAEEVREAIKTSNDAQPDDEAEEGTPLPEEEDDDEPTE